MVVTVTMTGYIKRTPLAVFREQKRGGKGRAGMATKDEDAVTNLFVTSTHNPVLFFSNLGKVYRMKVWRLPEGGPNAKGRPMVNLLPLAEGETISTVLPLPEDEAEWGGCTSCSRPPTAPSGATAWTPSPTSRPPARSRCASARDRGETEQRRRARRGQPPTDRLIGVELLTEEDDVLLATRNGKAIRFGRPTSASSSRAPRPACAASACRRRRGHLDVDPAPRRHHQEEREAYLAPRRGASARRRMHAAARALSPSSPRQAEQFILTVTENGYGKRSRL
jgi:DNA gyrase subunit A